MSRPCPGCGEIPTVRRLRKVWFVECDRWDCPLRPASIGRTEQEALEKWDMYALAGAGRDAAAGASRIDWRAR